MQYLGSRMRSCIPSVCLSSGCRCQLFFCCCFPGRHDWCLVSFRGSLFSKIRLFLLFLTILYDVQLILSGLIYRRFPELQSRKVSQQDNNVTHKSNLHWVMACLDPRDMIRDFTEFRKLPVFYSAFFLSCSSPHHLPRIIPQATSSIASIYLTVRPLFSQLLY